MLNLLPAAQLDLVRWEWPVWNQHDLNSCTAHAVAGAVQYLQVKHASHEPFPPSRLFIYYNERVLFDKLERPGAHTVDHNAPVFMRDGIKAVARWGCCDEKLWTDDPTELLDNFTKVPPPEAYDFAKDHRSVQYFKIDIKGKPEPEKLRQLKACLTEGFPFTIGVGLCASISHLQDGAIPTPEAGAKKTGGHALLVTGYDDHARRFTIRNSYGPEWGRDGYGSIGYDYVCNDELTDSFWTIRSMSC